MFPAQFWIFSKLLKHSKHCQVLAMFGMFETLRQLIDQKPSQWIKFQDWEPDKQRLEFKTVAGNKEHKFIGQKLGEDFAKFLWPSQNIWILQCLMVYHLICIIAHFESPHDSENSKTKEYGSK